LIARIGRERVSERLDAFRIRKTEVQGVPEARSLLGPCVAVSSGGEEGDALTSCGTWSSRSARPLDDLPNVAWVTLR
jgi:hypothetical protein